MYSFTTCQFYKIYAVEKIICIWVYYTILQIELSQAQTIGLQTPEWHRLISLFAMRFKQSWQLKINAIKTIVALK